MNHPHGASWVSTAHGASHLPGGGDEIKPEDIGAVPIDQLEEAVATTVLGALEGRISAIEAALRSHIAQKAGQAHK